MYNRLSHLSYHQLRILRVFLQAGKQVITLKQLQQKTPLKGKPLGAILSSLSRTRFRGSSLIVPVGKDLHTQTLRWTLNHQLLDISKAQAKVNQLLKTYA